MTGSLVLLATIGGWFAGCAMIVVWLFIEKRRKK
jgi:hypothetical protein